MILVDTNVVSDGMRPRPDLAVAKWLDNQPWDSLYLCTPVLAELRYGIELLPDSRRKRFLHDAVDLIENEFYRGRILSFDVPAVSHYARLSVVREQEGRRMDQMDAIIAAIAAAHGATIATRDIDGFSGLDLNVINPFDLP